jgi:hypothetical protein
MNLYILPGSYENLVVTIFKSVPFSQLEQALSAHVINQIRQKLGEQMPRCWAFSRETIGNYNQMQENDVVLFKENHTDSFSIRGSVADKVQSAALGKILWPIVGDKPWEFIFFIKDTKQVSIPFSRLCAELEYDENFWMAGAKRVSTERLNKAIRKHGTFTNFLSFLEGVSVPQQPAKTTIIRRTKTPPTIPTPQKIVQSNSTLQTTSPAPANWLHSFLPGIPKIRERILKLQDDQGHQERDHESLVEEFLVFLGYKISEDFNYRRGRIDICIQRNGNPHVIIEVKRDWPLCRDSKEVVRQAFHYALEHGARYVIITNGDYYALFDQQRGLSYDDKFVLEFTISKLEPSEFNLMAQIRKEILCD